MAYTRIHAIKSTVTKAVAYICNPDKTEQQLLVDSFGCSPETAKHDFDYALSRTKQSDKNQAYHLIQSFAKGEVSHEEAHRIGIELADKLLGGKYSYVVATHTDKGHPHNHIIFCAADNIDHKKYNACKKIYYHIRQLSDELCKEHNLSVIIPNSRKGKKYVEWKAEQENLSWKKRLREDIDECIKIAKSYEDFLRLIKEKGYTVTGEKIGDPHSKYIKFTAPGQERPVRGSFRNFGAGYTKEEIKDRIENPEKWQNKEETVQEPNTTEAPKQKSRIKIPKKDIVTKTSASRTLIDTSGDKFKNSPGLQHWASVKNLKTAAASYAAADNLSELQKQIDIKTSEAKSARTELVELEHQMKKVSELLLYAEQYRDNKTFQEKYKKSKDPDRYLRMHETQLILYDGAERMLRKMGLDPKSVDTAEIRADFEAMQKQKTALENKFKNSEKEAKSLQQKLSNVDQYVEYGHSRDNTPISKVSNEQKNDRKPNR
ncbi:relaxase/mobilization nuclease domain-containing protein [Oribacterium sp. NK2B42]|uniref:relaxase/mobilization nuclease domain-containing protein n=1 Tax=Oribacterium sp. NK2B42 TaxID=689781 RepID=UPI0004924A33|nr:relaxase/mobilization nuclease domain-containing protein [Oribacterium sp. NK2B42]